MKTLHVTERGEWREWLASHHGSETKIWLVFHKTHTGVTSISYGAAVEEALCFGWIDSIIRRIDEDRYVRKFTPRRIDSVWSESNKRRAERMIAEGRMTGAGLAQVVAA